MVFDLRIVSQCRLVRLHNALLDHPMILMCEGEERLCSGMQGVEW